MNASHAGSHNRRRLGTIGLAVGALGVVYGDIGTSPIYSLKETFNNEHHLLAVNETNVMGAVSVVLWTLILIIAIKYVLLVLRADNQGEGGILALTALIQPKDHASRRRLGPLVMLGLVGTALLFGDGVITPAISVLSAVEGTELINAGFHRWIIPMSVAILLCLFALQSKGTAKVGKIFGPVMLIWFGALAVLGTVNLAKSPRILEAFSPHHAFEYFQVNGFKAFLSMGALFLVVTGGEALYADMGHFGRGPIRLGWFSLVMPALMLCYLGIGGMLLKHPDYVDGPFFRLAPTGIRPALVVLATLATIIASQALISGVFSLTLQAINLGYLPRTKVINTSHEASGQIYLPVVNWVLMLCCVGLVLLFRTSSNLAAAYGLAVTATMFATTVLFSVYARRQWRWNPVVLGVATTFVLMIEGMFLGANLFKIPQGGWIPLAIGAVMLAQLTTWRTGKRIVYERTGANRVSIAHFAASLAKKNGSVTRVPGTSVFLYSRRGLVPTSMLTTLQSTHTLPTKVCIVCVETLSVPTVPPARRETHIAHPAGINEVILSYGFMDDTPIAEDLRTHLGIDPTNSFYFVGRESVRASSMPGMARWRENLFALMNRNTADVAAWFQLPQNRVVEIGSRIDL